MRSNPWAYAAGSWCHGPTNSEAPREFVYAGQCHDDVTLMDPLGVRVGTAQARVRPRAVTLGRADAGPDLRGGRGPGPARRGTVPIRQRPAGLGRRRGRADRRSRLRRPVGTADGGDDGPAGARWRDVRRRRATRAP